MLCNVIANTRRILRCQSVFIPSASSIGKPTCKCGNTLSTANKNKPPSKNPTAAGNHEGKELPFAISMDGASNDQKLAAIITPAAKPSIPSKNLRLTCLKKKTRLAPNAVTNHVKQVARNACQIGFNPENHSIIITLKNLFSI